MSKSLNPIDKKQSKTQILRNLHFHGPMSRIALTQLTGLSRATISTCVGELIEAGWVSEAEKQLTSRGRPAITLEMVPFTCAVLGADLHNNTWTLGAFDLNGNTIKTISFPAFAHSPRETLGILIREIRPFIKKLDVTTIPLIGLGLPGLINTEKGIIQSAVDLNWSEVPIKEMIDEELGWPSAILNRHKARGLAECRFGAGKDFNYMIYIGVGSGIASGLFQDRKLIHGAIGGSGEVGHITIEPRGILCPCGNHGCLQVYAAGPALESEARKLIRQGETSSLLGTKGDLQLLKAEDICAEAERGDNLSLKVVSQAAEYMGITMANLVNLFNPEAIILGGSIAMASSRYVEIATSVMKQRSMSSLSDVTHVTRASITEFGGALGAANFALDRYLSYPLLSQV
ncbi:ROK family transcriptional regulator [Paenibacillus montanisoli]|uniref:ROK family transcriptional regulator n=1 Tax=Paenibacillus montanisoli TaxID=2081970 RepID=A0A328UF15_9BACL|nr:ROK family transcriptional regulator [Paenibacillus montanisoli]RAP78546.1 ROK family transcriptional regulator [Paenibacillus montanisoli]